MGRTQRSARELWEDGIAAANARRFATARRVLARARAATDDPDLHARIDGTRAYVLGQTGEPSAAEALCRAVLDRTDLSAATRGMLEGQLGTLLMHAGRLAEASDRLDAAIEAASTTASTTASSTPPAADETISATELANLLLNRSVVRMQSRDLDGCTADLRRAIAVHDDADDRQWPAEAQHNLGYAALLRGDLVEALELMSRSRRIFAEGDPLALAISDQDRAEVLRDAGLLSEAEALLADAAARFGAQRMRQARAEAEFHLARSLVRHDPGRAATVARAAARRFRALGSDSWAARCDAVRLDAEVADGHLPAASVFADTATALRAAGFPVEATAVRLTAALAAHRRDGSRPRVPRLPVDAPTPLRLRAAEVRAARARDAEARRIAADGLDLLESWQRSFGALDLRASIAMHGAGLVFRGLRAARASGDPAVLFDWSERARHLSGQVVPVRPPHDPALAADLAELRMLRADLGGTEWTTADRVKTLRDRVRERQWSSTGATAARPRTTLPEAQSLLADGTALLAFVYTEDELLCVAATRDDARIATCDLAAVRAALPGLRADLDVSASVRTGPLAETVARTVEERMRRLSAALIDAALPPGPRRAVLTVPGLLAGIPWGLLPGLSGIPFTLATSASRWRDDERAHPSSLSPARRAPVSSPSPRLVPVNKTGAGKHDGGSAGGVRVGLAAGPRVPRAGEEVRRARDAWARDAGARDAGTAVASMLDGDDATVAAVTALAARSDVLHIAAHGRHAAENPLFSGVELADGTLFGYDVDLIATPPTTVVLSACEVGRSAVRWGEEALGMARVWLHAGTRSVIAAPVAVADDDACELLAELHVELAAGAAPADALAAASARTGIRAPFQVHGSGL